jgi:hypothetical protein
MGLGPDREICKTEFVEAMRARLIAEDPSAGANVDTPPIQANFGALGQAIYRIATVHAETASDAASDAAFWQWVSDVNAWLAALSNWQNGVALAFAAWAPTLPAEQALRAALTAVAGPGVLPAVTPTGLRGRIT